jgi:hypothetical protein
MTDTRIDKKALVAATEAFRLSKLSAESFALPTIIPLTAAITAYLKARKEAGFVEVPAVATLAMMRAAVRWGAEKNVDIERHETLAVYTAMLTAKDAN